jgi:transposase
LLVCSDHFCVLLLHSFTAVKWYNIDEVNRMLELNKQQSLSIYSELYKLIPQDHLLVEIHKLIDFSFIMDFVKEQYKLYYGRRAKDPEMLFRMVFIKRLYNLSDERVIVG